MDASQRYLKLHIVRYFRFRKKCKILMIHYCTYHDINIIFEKFFCKNHGFSNIKFFLLFVRITFVNFYVSKNEHSFIILRIFVDFYLMIMFYFFIFNVPNIPFFFISLYFYITSLKYNKK